MQPRPFGCVARPNNWRYQMAESWDEGLRGSAPEGPPLFESTGASRGKGPLVIAALLVIVAGGAVWYAFFRSPADPASSAATAQTATAPETSRPLGADADAIDLPPLDE